MNLRTSLYTKGTVLYPLHSEVQKVHSPNLWERKCEVARTGSRIIFHLSKLWKAEKFNVDHSWEWKGQILFAFSQIVHELMVCPHTSIHLPPRLGLAARSSLSADIWGACQYLQSFVRSVPSVRPSVRPFVRPFVRPSVRPVRPSVTLPPVVWRLRRGAQSSPPHRQPGLLQRRRAPTTGHWPLGLSATQNETSITTNTKCWWHSAVIRGR